MTRFLKRPGLIGILSLGISGTALGQLPLILTEPGERTSIDSCSALNGLELPELTRISAEWSRDGGSGPGRATNASAIDLPAHCRVSGLIEPAIRFEVWLPAADTWNGRFLAVGSKATGGSIDFDRMMRSLAAGYATAATDSGHSGDGYDWIADESLLRDYAYRSVYEMTAKSNVILARFYGKPAEFRYFNGCGHGGRQGLMEAQRFPSQYDGIVSGAPINSFVAAQTTELWATRAVRPSPRGPARLGPDTLSILSSAAIAQCDTLDGVADGVLEDPRRCGFDPARLQCGTGGAGQCLTSSAVTAATELYRGPYTSETGLIAPGFAIGSEELWNFEPDQISSQLALEFFRRAVHGDPGWDRPDFDLVNDHSLAMQKAGWLIDATSPDLSRFRDAGGRLLIYQGWNGTSGSPEAAIRYYEAVEVALTGRPNRSGIAPRDFARLFMVPDMAQCDGPVEFEAQRAIEAWVERGIAPDRIEAEWHDDGGSAIRTRPLCPYPQTARYRGSGNTDRSGNFTCEG